MPRIYWTAPAAVVLSFIAGILFALGHHLFYSRLDHKDASTSLEVHHVLGMHVTTQQFNTAVGTAFAFLVRACLMLSTSIAYFQILMWSVTKQKTGATKVSEMDVMTSALQDFISLLSLGAWWRRPWLWLLAAVAWLIPLASIITPATLSVGNDFPPSLFMNVPNVEFSSLNLAAPMSDYGTTPVGSGPTTGIDFEYAGPSLTLQRITNAVASQGFILPVAAPAVNSTWNLSFYGPSLHCSPVDSDFRHAVLANVLDYTFARGEAGILPTNCSYGPGYVAWHPSEMTPNASIAGYLPFMIDKLNSSSGALNNDISHGFPYNDMASVFIAIAPPLFSSTYDEDEDWDAPTMCQGKPWYEDGLKLLYNTSTVIRCDLHNSSYDTTFSFVAGVQEITFNDVKDLTHSPMITYGRATAFFMSSNQTDSTLQPQACPITNDDDSSDLSINCLTDPQVLATLSYQAVMHAVTDLVTGMISLGNEQDLLVEVDSTTQVTTTVLAEAPELEFLQSGQGQDRNKPPSVQQRAALWKQKPFTGLVNEVAALNSSLPFQEALEQIVRNITMSLMSAPDLQPNISSVYYPDKTEVHLQTLQNVYVYAADKLWLAYGLAIGATALFAAGGLAAIVANSASFSAKFSTILRLSRGAQLSCELEATDLSGKDPLATNVKDAAITFWQDGTVRDADAYMLLERPNKHHDREVEAQERLVEQS